jgi:hypothetical protein
MPTQRILKAQSNEIFCLWSFRNGFFPSPLLGIWRLSNLSLNSRRYPRFSVDFLLLFIAESRYSQYCYRELWLPASFMELSYKCIKEPLGCHLIQRFETTCIFLCGESQLPALFAAESLLTAGSHFVQILKDSPCLQRDIACRALLKGKF